jgi:hypothetical protein
MRTRGTFRQSGKDQLDDAVHAHRQLLARRHSRALPAFERLLRHVQSRSDLLRPADSTGGFRNQLNDGLLALALYHADWIRPIETWQPTKQNPYPQFASLAQHLFARYPVPACMTSVWFDLPVGDRLPQHFWFKHLGLGKNIRTAALPVPLTKAMAHLFSKAPHHFSAVAAIRWAQVRGLGGDERLAREVIGTRLGKVLENEGFWITVLQFLVNQPSLDLAQIGPVVDFLQHQRFEWRDGVSLNGVFGKQPPPRPDFSMKGRTPISICRLVEEWHKELGERTEQPTIFWPRSQIGEFQYVEGCEEQGNMKLWTITEILTNKALVFEGRTMRYCVATYIKECVSRQSSIWSMQVENQRGRHRVMTIEVDLAKKEICQARRKLNQRPQDREIEVLRLWATEQSLRVPDLLTH